MATQSPESANESKREKKRGGFFARLFGGGGSAGSGGTFGSGGFGGVGGAGGSFGGLAGRLLGSGILATKAGLLALILVGATVAGGLGLIGYNMMSGPAQPGDSVQLFASKPKNNSPELPPVPEDGASTSLKFFAQANSDPGTPEAPQVASAEAPKDAAAVGAAASNAGSEVGPSNVAAATGNGVSTLLKNGKFGQLTTPGSMGKGAVTAAGAKPGAGAAGDAGAAATAAHLGTLSAMNKGAASANGARSLAGRHFGNHGALGQAFGAMRDNRSATSSAGGGLTYDGAANAGSNIGANGSAIGAAPGDGTGPAQAKNVVNPAAVDPSLSPPPTPTAVDKAPWQNAIKTAQMLIGLAVALMLVAKLAAKTQYGKIIAMVIAAVVAGIGGMVIALGAQIANGQYGQKLQGGVLAAAGVGLMIAAAAIAFGGDSSKTDSTGLNTAGTADTAAGDVSGAGGTGASDSGSMLSSINPFVLIGGGIGLIGLAGTMMLPPKKYPSKDFPGGNPPDTHFFGTQLAPSEKALKDMVA